MGVSDEPPAVTTVRRRRQKSGAGHTTGTGGQPVSSDAVRPPIDVPRRDDDTAPDASRRVSRPVDGGGPTITTNGFDGV